MDTNMDTLIYITTLDAYEEKVYKGIYFFRGAEGQENIQFHFLANVAQCNPSNYLRLQATSRCDDDTKQVARHSISFPILWL
jgi:hypothetical protein